MDGDWIFILREPFDYMLDFVLESPMGFRGPLWGGVREQLLHVVQTYFRDSE